MGNAMKQWRDSPANADTISPWEETALMQAQLAWHQMFPGGGMVNGVPMMQTVSGRQVAQARRDYGHVSASSLLPQFSFRTRYSFYATEAVPGRDVTDPLIRVFGPTNFAHPTGFGTMGQWSTTFQQRASNHVSGAASNSPKPPPVTQGGQEDVGICGRELPVVTVAINLGVGPVSGETGDIFVIDWKAGAVHAYTYGGLGLGLSGPTPVTGAASIEIGALSSVNSRDELTGWGWALSGFAAVGPKGLAGQYFSNFSHGYDGATGGYAAGFGASVGGIVTYAKFNRTFSLKDAPQPIEGLISGCQK
jgi:hypothetical protein